MSNVAAVGFGRIGRLAVRAGRSGKRFTPSVIVDIAAGRVDGAAVRGRQQLRALARIRSARTIAL
jgi:glyceraldehyde-3-phosphate dehydrogenase/erythrose-4-phosphate dehydrogenase